MLGVCPSFRIIRCEASGENILSVISFSCRSAEFRREGTKCEVCMILQTESSELRLKVVSGFRLRVMETSLSE